jgi:hypothetical protein
MTKRHSAETIDSVSGDAYAAFTLCLLPNEPSDEFLALSYWAA